TDPTNDTTPTFSGSAGTQAADSSHSADDATVAIKVEDASNAVVASYTPSVDGSGNWTQTVAALDALAPDGTYTVKVSQSDAAGNTGHATDQSFVLDTHAPARTLDPVTDPTNDTTPTFSGSAGTQAADSSHSADD